MVALAQGYVHTGGLPRRATGARPSPRHTLAAAVPFRPLFAPPPWWIWLPRTLSYWLNNVDGDCVTAEEAFARACSGILISDSVVRTWATQHGVMNGAVISDVLDWMANPSGGFQQDGNVYGAGPKSSIDFTSSQALCAAIAQGPVKIGVAAAQLQNAVGDRNGWFATTINKDSDYDHCVSLCAYGRAAEVAQALSVTVPAGVDPSTFGYGLFTWDTVGFVSERSMINITCEAWLRSPTTTKQGNNPVTPDQVYTPTPTPPGPPDPPSPPPPPPPAVRTLFSVNVYSSIRRGQNMTIRRLPVDVPAGRYNFDASTGEVSAEAVDPN